MHHYYLGLQMFLTSLIHRFGKVLLRMPLEPAVAQVSPSIAMDQTGGSSGTETSPEAAWPESWSLSAVPPEQLDLVWEQVKGKIEEGLSHGEGDCLTLEGVYDRILDGRWQLWAVHDDLDVIATIILNVIQHPAKKVVFVVLIAGRDFKYWAPVVQEKIREFARLVEADAIEASVRLGLAKWLTLMGWSHKAVIMSLEIES